MSGMIYSNVQIVTVYSDTKLVNSENWIAFHVLTAACEIQCCLHFYFSASRPANRENV